MVCCTADATAILLLSDMGNVVSGTYIKELTSREFIEMMQKIFIEKLITIRILGLG